MQTTAIHTEVDAYREAFAHEGEITQKLLRAFPADRVDARPSDSAQTTREIAWMLVVGMMLVEPILAGRLLPEGGQPAPPADWQDLVDSFARTLGATKEKIAALDDAAMNGAITTLIGPNTIGEARRGDMLRMFLHDQIHHRGQLSVHLRMAGGRVPSIYGPSKDEPWF
jgi:uncharacterized damage-inducible protein DinB